MENLVSGFFAYPSHPASIDPTIKGAIEEINKSECCRLSPWTECKTGGKFLIDVICRAIDAAQLFCADLTTLNPNVMFELGYAIARNKRIWLIMDRSIEESHKVFQQVRILTTVGHVPYCNSREIVHGFYKDQPWIDHKESLISGILASREPSSNNEPLLYLKTRHDTEASVRLTNCITRFHLPMILDDPRESSVHSLNWYAEKVLSAIAVIAHFCSPSREGHVVHNSKYALVSGFAHGSEKRLLMLAESDYRTPIDYHDILASYDTPDQCVTVAGKWLELVSEDYDKGQRNRQVYQASVALVKDLRSLRVGEYIAEHEEADLENYFVETSAFIEALEGRQTLVVGKKGSGKTANLFSMARRLGQDKRNLVCIIKPVSYEIDGVVRLIKKYREKDEKGYLVEAIWKYLLYTELAKVAVASIESRPIQAGRTEDETNLLALCSQNEEELVQDFTIRLERIVDSLLGVPALEKIEGFRTAVSERLHDGILRKLRELLGKVIGGRERIAVLIDNLDKSWDRKSDLDSLSEFLLGLLRVAKDVRQEFSKKDTWRRPVPVTMTIFLRSDIFSHVMRWAREPDKIAHSRLLWNDREMLLRVLDERLSSSRGGEDPCTIWRTMFCETVQGIPVRDYLVRHVLPRPRDLVFLTSAAIATAVNRAHVRVEERDILEAQKQYSQFAFDSIQVENGITVPELETILYEFAGQRATLSEEDALALISKAGIEEERRQAALKHLCTLSFLGVEVKVGEYVFSGDEEEAQINLVLARKLAATRNTGLSYQVNIPFHPFLEITC